jgi:hypothetical protein
MTMRSRMIFGCALTLGLAATVLPGEPRATPLAAGEVAATRPSPAMPAIVSRVDWGSTPLPIPDDRKQVPTVITLHHAGVLWKPGDDPAVKIKNLQSWGQKEKNWPDVPYHYLIAPDGKIFEGRDWQFEPESNTKYDLNGVLNLHLWGDFNQQRVSIEQLRATVELCAWACAKFDIDPATLRGHADAAPGQTTCPGADFHRYLSDGLIQKWVAARLAGEVPKVVALEPLPAGPTTQVGF